MLSAYLFALTDVELDRSHVERFAELVPAPDTMIYVKAPIEALVERALARPDPRPQHAGKSRREVERTIARTVGVFDLVAGSPPLRDRVLVVENDDDHERLHRLADGVASELRVSAEASDMPRPRAARISPDRLHAGD